jgi:hypothetical protein
MEVGARVIACLVRYILPLTVGGLLLVLLLLVLLVLVGVR